MNPETRTCQNCKNSFAIEPEDFKFYEKIKVPPPTWCPECRMMRRMMFRNERVLYRRKCNALGHDEEIISVFSPEKPFTVYDYKYWWSDAWNPFDYGRDYDFSKPFFQQFEELKGSFPLLALSNSRAENSEYCNVNDKSKDCYLASASYEIEKVLYSNRVAFTKDSTDVYISTKNELCYENVACRDSYKLFFSRDSTNCVDSTFLYNCHNCQNCFGGANLRNRQYYFFNEPCTKEHYQEKVKSFDLGSWQNLQKARQEFKNIYDKSIHRYAAILKSVNVTGDKVTNTKNCQHCFDIELAEDSKFINWGGYNMKDSYDSGPGTGDSSELLYEAFDAVKVSRLLGVGVVYDSHDVRYGFNCYNSDNLFGCIGLRKKQYCILNKQYTKEEYEKLVPRIIEHMNSMPYIDQKGRVYKYGEFFPPELSPFAYNETIAQEYFPLTKEEAIEKGYSWKDPEPRNYQIQITNDKLPDHIKDATDDIVGQVIECQHASGSPSETSGQTAGAVCNEQCTEAYKIIPQELVFLRRMNLPLPRLCPNCRHYQRIKQRNPLKLWHRKCQCAGLTSENKVYQNTADHIHHKSTEHCPNEFKTTYAPERPEIIYCEQCYLREVV